MEDLWGNPVLRRGEYFVFHDESIPNKQWFLIGLVFVQAKHVDEAKTMLRRARQAEGYFGEVHFSALPRSFGGDYGAKARVALRWMRMFEENLAEVVNFSCFAVDRKSPKYEHSRFKADFHAYNRFTAMALKAGIAWHLGPLRWDEVIIHFVPDAKDRQSRPDKGLIDNFEEYLPYRAELDAFLSQEEGKHYPSLSLILDPRDSEKEDLLQFCDVLLGATQMALVAGSSKATKRKLGQFVVRWCLDLQQPPWQQIYKLHRKFNLWGFPDREGKPYNNVPLALPADDAQLPLF